MNKYETSKPLKFSAKQEAQHNAHEARIDYVGKHRGEFLQLIAAASEQSLQETVEETGFGASITGRSFDEFLYQRWRALYHPDAPHINFNTRPINFAAYQSLMAVANRESANAS